MKFNVETKAITSNGQIKLTGLLIPFSSKEIKQLDKISRSNQDYFTREFELIRDSIKKGMKDHMDVLGFDVSLVDDKSINVDEFRKTVFAIEHDLDQPIDKSYFNVSMTKGKYTISVVITLQD